MASPPIRLNAATLQDTDLLAEMNGRLIEDENYDKRFTSHELCTRMRGFLESTYRAYLFHTGEQPRSDVVGYVLVNLAQDPIYIRQFYVRPEYRRMGHGRRAIAALREELKVRDLDVEVMIWNETGLAFWKGLGFVPRYVGLGLRSPGNAASTAESKEVGYG
jgi:ribosomal protein S18 acetylase RimI-like enzyme